MEVRTVCRECNTILYHETDMGTGQFDVDTVVLSVEPCAKCRIRPNDPDLYCNECGMVLDVNWEGDHFTVMKCYCDPGQE